jgi:hypothetical protein
MLQKCCAIILPPAVMYFTDPVIMLIMSLRISQFFFWSGIYVPFIHSDVESLAFYYKIREILHDLSNTFQTTKHDHGRRLHRSAPSNRYVKLPQKHTSALLQDIIQVLNLVNMASRARKMQQTWYWRNDQHTIFQAWREVDLDYKTTITMFDHVLVQANFRQKRPKTTPTMKDYHTS